jgi:hypothetical protein
VAGLPAGVVVQTKAPASSIRIKDSTERTTPSAQSGCHPALTKAGSFSLAELTKLTKKLETTFHI